MSVKRCYIGLVVAAAVAVPIGAAPSAAAASAVAQHSCTSITDANTACQWPASTSAESDNTPSAPYTSQTPYNGR